MLNDDNSRFWVKDMRRRTTRRVILASRATPPQAAGSQKSGLCVRSRGNGRNFNPRVHYFSIIRVYFQLYQFLSIVFGNPRVYRNPRNPSYLRGD